ncbi:hypothetical protein MJL33_30890, partial [Salmonella enterica subsp. enterica serovar Kentucky]|nr:hypothetical protein [Salmonella enterica subsp. enterica serovar Kentucky]
NFVRTTLLAATLAGVSFGAFATAVPNPPLPAQDPIVQHLKLTYTRWGYRELLEKQSIAVAQPDLCLCGGITEGKKICDYANIYD